MTTDSIVDRVMEAAKLLGDEDSQGHPTVKLSFLRTILQEQLGGMVLVPREPTNDMMLEGLSKYNSLAPFTPVSGRFALLEAVYITMTEAGDAPVEYGCHCDLEPHMKPDACVLDENRPRDCIYAVGLKASGRGKESCGYWQPITIVTEAGEGK